MSDTPESTDGFEPEIVEGLEDGDLELTADEADAAMPRAKGLTPKQAFQLIAIGLIVILAALIIYLLFFLPTGLVQRGGAEKAGIEPVFVIDGPGTGKEPLFDKPMGVAFARDGSIFVADSGNNRICVFDRNGRFLFEFGGFGVAKPLAGGKYSWRPGLLNYPLGLDTDEQGNLYVADFYNDQVQKFSPTGKPLARFPDPTQPVGRGSSGQDGTGIAVTDVAARDGRVWATDTWQIFSFDASGTFASQFGKPGRGASDLDHPNGIDVGADGTVYVADSNHSRVLAFTPQGKLKWSVGSIPTGTSGKNSDVFGLPRGLVVTEGGNILVVDAFNFQIVAISPEGKVIGRFGERGTEPGQLNFANAIDSQGDLVLVADKDNNRVQVLRLVGLR
jgi:DNA-binding beta-propeller fold protein YncE